MTKQSKIIATEARIPLAMLTLSPLNPRQHVPEHEVAELAQSIWAAGLIQPIAGLGDDMGGADIVAGGRRLRALQYLAEQHPNMADTRPELANPMVMLAPDAETAEQWAYAENVARRDLSPADEIRAYGKMEAAGSTPAAIARSFAVTEKHVYRRLALAHLSDPIIEALAAGEINLSMAACFTISDDEKRSLEVLEHVRGESWSDYQLKSLLKPDSVEGSNRRAVYVGEEAYKAAGGKIGGDLFAEVTLFDNPEILDEVFNAKLDAAAKEVCEAEGWKWVDTVTEPYVCTYSMGLEKFGRIYPVEGILTEEQVERFDELGELEDGGVLDEEGQAELDALQVILDGDFTEEQKAHAGAFVYVDREGAVKLSAGMVKPEDKQAAIDAGILKKSAHSTGNSDVKKSPISQKLADDLSRIAQGAQQHAILRDPDLLIDLLAYQLSHNLFWKTPFGISMNTVPNWPTTEGNGYELDERLTSNPPRDMYDAKDLGASFRAFRKKGADHIKGELTRFLAAQYQGGEAKLAAMVAKETKPSIREVWTPTAENFFGRVGGPYMVEIWRDLLDLSEDHPTATTFAKLKKGEKAEKLEKLFSDADMRKAHNVTDEQAAKIDAWLPEGMA
ncbi:ParB/RepB/Spo0J family partition protein [uncultured Aliiroseovarius sp.]|uniref:ParB/RepB/Spo0J family partition protein n=1 Tax=uncultured Aliiroseovarius sp. TaxID=1658783 RepID=UPI0026095B17|nr:ParB/RepB/Spo0J family partition protein [uncultured Aliiroseovarius sp.]